MELERQLTVMTRADSKGDQLNSPTGQLNIGWAAKDINKSAHRWFTDIPIQETVVVDSVLLILAS